MLPVLEEPPPPLDQSPLHLLVPYAVDEPVEHGHGHGVEDGGHLIQSPVARGRL